MLPRVERAYVHADLDVLDPREGRANGFAGRGTLRPETLVRAVEQVGAVLPVHAAALTASPRVDDTCRVPVAAARIARAIVVTAAEPD